MKRALRPGQLRVSRSLRLTLAVAGCLWVSACGAPEPGTLVVVDREQVPYGLLETPPAGQSSRTAVSGPRLYFVRDDKLVGAEPVTAPSGSRVEEAQQLLDQLIQGPSSPQHVAGMSSSLSPALHLSVEEVTDGVAQVRMHTDQDTQQVSPDAPLAMGQIVLTITSVPGISAVTFNDGIALVQAPLPGGALTASAVGAEDYSELVQLD